MRKLSLVRRLSVSLVVLGLLAGAAAPVFAESDNPIHVDVPVALKEAKVVFNMDHAAFAGDMPVGLKHMLLMTDRFKQIGTQWNMVAVFHGDGGYMLLNDETYNAVRHVQTGNPYKALVAQLIERGVQVEECAVTMKGSHWGNANLLPGVKVNSGADGRIIQLEQDGYIMLQP